ncbi:MAG: hypothetical protein FWD61_18875 [Phycisphaerales bacterium]|nr:hypothetical protein [Phycisphaerales bacterium]
MTIASPIVICHSSFSPLLFFPMPQHKQGVILASIALLLWSTSSATTVFTGDRIGGWQFLAIATFIAGILQVAACSLHLKMPLKNIFAPPPKLLILILFTFTLYMLVYTNGLVLAAKSQKVGVNLLNFLWPTLTVVFAAVLVPGSKMSKRLILALIVAFAGVLLANFQGLHELFTDTNSDNKHLSLLPYLFGLMAGITWGAYSAFLARWKDWAGQYATSPLGFLLTSAIAFAICLSTGTWNHMDTISWIGVLYMAVGPQAAAYLLWELALNRAPARTLGLLASGNTVASTAWIFAITPFLQGGSSHPNYLHTALAAILITVAIILGRE